MKCCAQGHRAGKGLSQDLSPGVPTNHCSTFFHWKLSLLETALALYLYVHPLLGWDKLRSIPALAASDSGIIRGSSEGDMRPPWWLSVAGFTSKRVSSPSPFPSALYAGCSFRIPGLSFWISIVCRSKSAICGFPTMALCSIIEPVLFAFLSSGKAQAWGLACPLAWWPAIILSSAPTLHSGGRRTGQKAELCYPKAKTQIKLQLLPRNGIVMMPVLLNKYFATLKEKCGFKSGMAMFIRE